MATYRISYLVGGERKSPNNFQIRERGYTLSPETYVKGRFFGANPNTRVFNLSYDNVTQEIIFDYGTTVLTTGEESLLNTYVSDYLNKSSFTTIDNIIKIAYASFNPKSLIETDDTVDDLFAIRDNLKLTIQARGGFANLDIGEKRAVSVDFFIPDYLDRVSAFEDATELEEITKTSSRFISTSIPINYHQELKNAILMMDGSELDIFLPNWFKNVRPWSENEIKKLVSDNETAISGQTFNSGTLELITTLNDSGGTQFVSNLSSLTSDRVITGGTYDSGTGIITYMTNSGNTFQVSGFITGSTDNYISGGTYNNLTGDVTLTDISNNNVIITGLTDSNDNEFVTGGTYVNNLGEINFTTNSGSTFDINGFYTGNTGSDKTTQDFRLTHNLSDTDKIFRSLAINVGSFISSTSFFNTIIIFDKDENAYDSNDFFILSDSEGGFLNGQSLGVNDISPFTINSNRTVTIGYSGETKLNGFSGIRANHHPDFASTSLNSLNFSYGYEPDEFIPFSSVGTIQGTFTYTANTVEFTTVPLNIAKNYFENKLTEKTPTTIFQTPTVPESPIEGDQTLLAYEDGIVIATFTNGFWLNLRVLNDTYWETLSANTTVNSGNYLVDSSSNSINISLTHEVNKEYEFSDFKNNSSINPITIGTAGNTFINSSGTTITGPYVIQENGVNFKLVGTSTNNQYAIVREISQLNNLTQSDINNPTSTFGQVSGLLLNNWLNDNEQGSFWKANTSVSVGDIRLSINPEDLGQRRLYVCIIPHTTRPTFDSIEALDWQDLGETTRNIPTWTPLITSQAQHNLESRLNTEDFGLFTIVQQDIGDPLTTDLFFSGTSKFLLDFGTTPRTSTDISTGVTITANVGDVFTIRRFNNDNYSIQKIVDSSNTTLTGITNSDILIGQLFWDTNNTPTTGKLFQGETYNWSDNPKLQTKFTSQGHGFITDNNNGTFTIASHTDFIRAGVSNIGTHVNDTTAVNGLNITGPLSTRVGVSGGPNSAWFGDSGNGGQAGLNGDSETAPNHRNAYFGIYGDLTQLVVDSTLLSVENLSKSRIKYTSTVNQNFNNSNPRVNFDAITIGKAITENWNLVNDEWICQDAGEYDIEWTGGWIGSAESSSIAARLYHVNSGNTITLLDEDFSNYIEVDGVGSKSGGNFILKNTFDFNVGDKIRINIQNGNGFDATLHNSDLKVEKNIVQKTVVSSDLVPIEDIRIVEYSKTTSLGFGPIYSIDNNRIWNNLKSDYEYLEFNFEVDVTGVSDDVLRTIRIKTSDLRDDTVFRFEYGSAVIDFQPGNLTTGDFAFVGATVDSIALEIIGVKSQKTVINANDLTITNPNETNTNTILKPNGDGTATFQPEVSASVSYQYQILPSNGSSVDFEGITFRIFSGDANLTWRRTAGNLNITNVLSRWEQGGEGYAFAPTRTITTSYTNSTIAAIAFTVAGAVEEVFWQIGTQKYKVRATIGASYTNNLIEFWKL